MNLFKRDELLYLLKDALEAYDERMEQKNMSHKKNGFHMDHGPRVKMRNLAIDIKWGGNINEK